MSRPKGKNRMSSDSRSTKDRNESASDRQTDHRRLNGYSTHEKCEEDLPRKCCRHSERCSKVHDCSVYPEYTRKMKEKVFKANVSHKTSKENCSDKELALSANNSESTSSGKDEAKSRFHPSAQSSDRSKSFSQIYSEIFEESKARQQKGERACRTYNINKSKLRRTRELSGSRGPGSGFYDDESSVESEYSSHSPRETREYESRSTDEREKIVKDHGIKRSERTLNKSISNRESRNSYSHCSENRCWEDSFHKRNRPRACMCEQASVSCTTGSVRSRSRKHHSRNCDSEVTDGSDYPADRRCDPSSGIPATATSRSQRDYLSSCSTRHRHHHHYRRRRSVSKTYQDRGNSPINIKTRRRRPDSQELRDGSGTDLVCKPSTSVGVQYPSDDEIEDYSDASADEIVQIVQDKELNLKGKAHDIDSRESFEEVSSDERIPNEMEQYTCDYFIADSAIFRRSDKGEEYRTENNQETKTNHYEESCSDEYDGIDLSEDINTEEEDQQGEFDVAEYRDDQGWTNEEKLSSSDEGQSSNYDNELELTKEKSEAKTKSLLNLRIYDADEALMEIPEDFEGPAVVLDDDADFLDITLTDDEEQIRAKLMAAALTTRRSSCSTSASDSIKSRRSVESSTLSYKPSVIFARRSETDGKESAPRKKDRVALLAEQLLQSLSSNSESEWQPLVQEVTTPDSEWPHSEESEVTKKPFRELDRQLLSEEFNRKLHRQLKVVVKSFQ